MAASGPHRQSRLPWRARRRRRKLRRRLAAAAEVKLPQCSRVNSHGGGGGGARGRPLRRLSRAAPPPPPRRGIRAPRALRAPHTARGRPRSARVGGEASGRRRPRLQPGPPPPPLPPPPGPRPEAAPEAVASRQVSSPGRRRGCGGCGPPGSGSPEPSRGRGPSSPSPHPSWLNWGWAHSAGLRGGGWGGRRGRPDRLTREALRTWGTEGARC